jgi:hypothetical protein
MSSAPRIVAVESRKEGRKEAILRWLAVGGGKAGLMPIGNAGYGIYIRQVVI